MPDLRRPTAHSLHLRAIARRVVEAFDCYSPPRAVLLAGSAGTGSADAHSDVDLILYYGDLPGRDTVDAVRGVLGVERGEGSFFFEGVECQVGAMQVDHVDRRIHELLSGKEPASAPHQKVAEGLLQGLALRDDGLIAGWRARLAAFPDVLAEAMAEHYLQVFAYWTVQERIARRDASFFELQSLLDGAFHVLGALSAANGRYFTSSQFKRLREHVAALEVAPANLAERLESLFELDRPAAAQELRQLVAEAVTIVESRIPKVDTAAIRQALEN